MLPYWAIIKDSFREALHSYVLWGLIVALTSLLLLLVPFSYGQQLTGDLRWGNVADWKQLIEQMKLEAAASKPSPGKQIWPLINKNLRTEIDKLWKDFDARPNLESLTDEELSERLGRARNVFTTFQLELDRVLSEPKFYDKKAWAGVKVGEEATELLDDDAAALGEKRLRRRNRLLLEAAYPDLVDPSPKQSIRPTYMGLVIPELPWLPWIGAPAETTREAVVTWYRGYIGWLMNWPFTMLLVMIGIVATSAIIPRMLDPGALSLLLSKPVTRSGLYLAKFLGGCAFMLLSATYVVGGLWLIAGVRLGIWDPKVFLCIPLFTYTFAVYFAVSALVGMLWRSSVLAILGVVVFWMLCTMFWYAKEHFETNELDSRRLVDLIDAGDTLIAVDDDFNQHSYFWDENAHEWKEIFRRQMSFDFNQSKQPIVFEPKHRRLVAPLVMYDARLVVAREEDAWATKKGVVLPDSLANLFVERDGDLLGVTRQGFVRIKGNPLSDGKPLDQTKDLDALELAGPAKPLRIEGPLAAAFDAQTSTLALYAGGKLTTYRPDPKQPSQYVQVKQRTLSEGDQAGTIGMAGKTIVIGREDGTLLFLNAKTLNETMSRQPEGDVPPRFIKASPDGKWIAILFQNRRLWLYETQSQSLRRAGLWSQGEISGVAFSDDDKLLVADNVARVREMELPSLNVVRTFSPANLPRSTNDWRDRSYRYFVLPIYTILPRPGELGRTLNYLVTGEKTKATFTSKAFTSRDIATDRHVQRNPWTPVWTCGIFIAVMLVLGCFIIEKREF